MIIHKAWQCLMWLVPCGVSVRKFMAMLLIIRGFIYIAYRVIDLPVTSHPYSWYGLVLLDLPLQVYGLLMLSAGIPLLASVNHRHDWFGRLSSAYAAGVCAFMSAGVLHSSALQASSYVLMIIVLVREAAYGRDQEQLMNCNKVLGEKG